MDKEDSPLLDGEAADCEGAEGESAGDNAAARQGSGSDTFRQLSEDSAKDSAKDEGSGDERATQAAAMAALLSPPGAVPAPRQDSDGSADELNQDNYYYDDSCSEHSEGPAPAVPLLQRGRRTRRQLKQRVEGLVTELRKRREVFNRRQWSLAQSVNQRAQSVNQRLRHQWLAQQERLVLRSKQMTAKLQSGRSRAWRHKWIFAMVQADFVGSAFWLGFSPETYYLYYTAQVLFMIGCKVFDYRVKAQHYFLLDFCFFANFCILSWLWLFPSSGYFFNASEGVVGLLAISVVAFRNSCVPHDFVRISHAYIHFPAVVVMLSVKMRCEGDICLGIQAGEARHWYRRFVDAWSMYASWAVAYGSVIFVIAKKRIDRKQRDTLYNYFAVTLGFNDKLPKWLRPYSKGMFMLGHMGLFLCGIWWIFLSLPFQVLGTAIVLLAFFHNGGRYYVDHFWKTYERNTLLYVDAAYSAMSKDSARADQGGAVEGDAAMPKEDEQ
mmetsp:Transcript_89450/g.278374  ORF Transcript_89450/g.278374 Transcript_89450/m.278374 type:complete len:495 (-) Transcript_89450:46-1530(-)